MPHGHVQVGTVRPREQGKPVGRQDQNMVAPAPGAQAAVPCPLALLSRKQSIFSDLGSVQGGAGWSLGPQASPDRLGRNLLWSELPSPGLP